LDRWKIFATSRKRVECRLAVEEVVRGGEKMVLILGLKLAEIN
jgi:hypothetical protein